MKFSYALVGIILASFTVSEARDLCFKPCTLDINPVCGTDGLESRIFDNACEIENQHCNDGRFWYQTRMTECYARSESPKCLTACTLEYFPVCGTDGLESRVFPNRCAMKNQHCLDGHSWSETRMTECYARSEPVKNKLSCMKPCTFDYRPVCGTDGLEARVFPNACAMENEHCLDGHSWFQTRMTECYARSEITEKEMSCMKPCTYDYRPVCGTDGLESRVFPNKCAMENEHCLDGQNWSQTRMTECYARSSPAQDKQSCMIPCTDDYTPVCGTDGLEARVFPNACAIKNQHCEDGHSWFQTRITECFARSAPTKEQIACTTPCTFIYKPVCGTDGLESKVFASECVMKNEHCMDGHNWYQTRMTECYARLEKKNCMVPCTRDFKPVCGFDGEHYKLFNNECMLKNEHCLDGHSWKIAPRMSECLMQSTAVNSNDIVPVVSEPKNCPLICPAIYAPVCGFDGEKYEMFASECTMTARGCLRNHQYTKADMSNCDVKSRSEGKNCFVPCTREFEPICGFDGRIHKIFNNKCMMRNAHCEDGHDWVQTRMVECEKRSNEGCPKICPEIFAPVCGYDGQHLKFFANDCLMNAANCLDNHSYRKVALDKCEIM